jgi:hypothetical protein
MMKIIVLYIYIMWPFINIKRNVIYHVTMTFDI